MTTIVTEREAKTKWCPMVRTGLTTGISVNHHVDMTKGGAGVYDETRCIGSACMMWRFVAGSSRGYGEKGFCGLAGKPW